jgi:hypothetical protein
VPADDLCGASSGPRSGSYPPKLKAADPELLKFMTEEMPMYLEKFSSEMLI